MTTHHRHFNANGYAFRFVQFKSEAIRDNNGVQTGFFASSLTVAVFDMPGELNPGEVISECIDHVKETKFNNWVVSNTPVHQISGFRIYAPNNKELDIPENALLAVSLNFRTRL